MLKLFYDKQTNCYVLDIREQYIIGTDDIGECKEMALDLINTHIDEYINNRLSMMEVEPTVQVPWREGYGCDKGNGR